MTINREHLAGLELALAEIPVYGESADRIRALIAKAQAAPEAEPVAWVRRSGRFGCKQYMTDRQYQAQSALMRANYEPYSCARCTAPQHDAELVELLNLAADTLDNVCHGSMLEQTIRAKLATLRHV